MTINNEKILDTFINKNEKLATDINNSIKEVFNSQILKEIFSSEHRQIKYVVFENKCLIFDRLNGLISVHIDHHIKKNYISSFDLERINNDKNAKIYLPAIANRNERFLNHKTTTEELKNKLLPLVQEGIITQEMADEFINKRDILFSDYEYTFSNDIHDISLFIKFLQSHSYLTYLSHDEFILELITQSAECYKDNFYYLSSSIHNMIECAVNNDMYSYETSAEFNDCDNNFWITPLKTVIMSEQSIMYCIFYKDLYNCDIYALNTDEQPKELYEEYYQKYDSISFNDFLVLNLEQKIQNNNNIDFQNKVLSLTDNQLTFINPLFFNYLFSSLKYFVAFLKLNHKLQEKYPEDVYSYNYQKKYFKHKYNLDEFKFLCHAFLTLGSDFQYDQQTGRFIKLDIEYIHNLPELENKNDVSIQQIGYLYPQKISFLNADWTHGLIYLVKQLELNKPDFLAHDFKYKTKEEAFKKSIAYLKKVIKKNSKQLKNDIITQI